MNKIVSFAASALLAASTASAAAPEPRVEERPLQPCTDATASIGAGIAETERTATFLREAISVRETMSGKGGRSRPALDPIDREVATHQYRVLATATIATMLYDMTTTHLGQSRCDSCKEQNPLLRAAGSPVAADAALAAVTGVILWKGYHDMTHGKPGWSYAMRAAIIGHGIEGSANLRYVF